MNRYHLSSPSFHHDDDDDDDVVDYDSTIRDLDASIASCRSTRLDRNNALRHDLEQQSSEVVTIYIRSSSCFDSIYDLRSPCISSTSNTMTFSSSLVKMDVTT